MDVGNLFNQAVNISSAFLRILQEDADLDSSYSLNIAQIEQRYKSKISELDLKRNRRISNAAAQDQSAQTNIHDALNALAEAKARIPEKYRKKYRQTSLTPKFPNFQALDELAARINDGSFGGAIKRLTGIGGYTSMMDMVNDYLDHVEAGRMYLHGEQKKSSSYLAQEKASANAEYIREKAVVEQKKANLIARNNQAYDYAGSALQDKLLVAIDDPALPQYDANLTDLLERLGAFDETWDNYEASLSYPKQLMIGAITVPFTIPSPADQMIQEKMPVAFSSGRGFCVPMTVDMSKPLQLLINYDDRCKAEVMEGIQSIILKWIRYMPPYSFTLTYIDPND